MRPVDPVEAEDACILCGSRAARRLFPARDRLHNLPGDFWVVRCLSCELIRTCPRPSGETLAAYYPDNYGPHAEVTAGDSGADPILGLWGRLRRGVVSRRVWWLPDLPPGARVLELGSGSGYFVGHALARGWEVHALEPAVRAAERLARDPRVRVHREAAEQMDFPPGSVDAVFAWMVVERLEDPVGVHRKVAAALKPGGYFVFSLPNAGSWEFFVFRARWWALEIPRHLWHWCPRTLRRLLALTGFSLERIFHQKVLRNISGSLDYLGADRPRLAPLTRALARFLSVPQVSFGIGAILAALRQGGRLTVVARARRSTTG